MLSGLTSPLDDPERLDALRRTTLMGAPAEELFDRLTRLAARALGAPVALLSLVDDQRQFLVSAAGLTGDVAVRREVPLSHSFCRHVVERGEALLVDDAREHPLVRENPAIDELGWVAYAGVPLEVDGAVVGSFAVLDRAPRAWSDEELGVLHDLAANAVSEFRWRREAALRAEGEERLRESERNFRSLIENSSDVIAVLSAGGVVRYQSPSVTQVLGYGREEMVGRSAWELVHPQDVTEVIQRFTRSAAGTPCDDVLEVRLRRKDGAWGTFEARVSNLLGDAAVGGMVVTARDLTQRRQAEENHARLAAILTASPDFVATLDPYGRALFLNPAGQAMLGVADSAVASSNIPDFYPPGETARLLGEAIPTAMREGIWTGETALLAADGREIPVDQVVLAHRSTGGSPDFLSIIARDISEQKRAAEALRRSEEHFRSLIENALDIIHLMDAEGRVTYVSPAVKHVLGYPPESLIGGNAWDLVHPDDLARVQEDFRAAVQQPAEDRGGTATLARVRHRDGSWRIFEMRSRDLTDHPAVGGVVVNSRDVTERHQAEAALEESRQQLLQSQKMDAVGRLAGGVAHDFNNLLTAIKGFTELLLLDFDDRDPRRSFITEIQGAANRAASLTRQLLAFSRKQVLQPRVLDINASVSEMEKMLQRLIGEHVQLVTSPDRALGRVKADPGQMEQVIMNLVVNARDAMPEGGQVRVSTSNTEVGPDRIPRGADAQPGSFVVLTVQDTGHGMDEATLERIFEPFFTTKEQGKGTGLGLSTVYGIVQQSGGFVEVKSAVGRGTTFRVLLPRVDEQLPAPVRRSSHGGLAGSETVLLVEDELAVRVLVRRVLDRAGYRVLEADSGAAALRLLERPSAPVDLLLTDVIMPGMSGRELADQLAARFPSMKILYMSGYTDEAIVHHGVLEPGVFFVEKPFTPDILLRKLRDVLEAGSPA